MPSLPRSTPAEDEDGVVAVVGDDLLQVLGAERLRVVVEDRLGLRVAAMGRLLSLRRGQPYQLISTDDKAAHKRRCHGDGYWRQA